MAEIGVIVASDPKIMTAHQFAAWAGKHVNQIHSAMRILSTHTDETTLDRCYPFSVGKKGSEGFISGPPFVVVNEKAYRYISRMTKYE